MGVQGGRVASPVLGGVLSVDAADSHVFVLVNLGHAAWFAALGALLLRARPRDRAPGREPPA